MGCDTGCDGAAVGGSDGTSSVMLPTLSARVSRASMPRRLWRVGQGVRSRTMCSSLLLVMARKVDVRLGLGGGRGGEVGLPLAVGGCRWAGLAGGEQAVEVRL